MDTSCASTMHGRTPEATSFAHDSGYITATPSPQCNESSESSVESERRTNYLEILDTPIANQKCNKVVGLRKYLLQENYSVSALETTAEGRKAASYNTHCSSCSTALHASGSDIPFTPESNKTLTDCFCNLRVHDVPNIEFSPCSSIAPKDKGPTHSKTKPTSYLTSVSVKKFKSDTNDVFSPVVKQPTKESAVRYSNFIGVSRVDFLLNFSGLTGCFPGIVSHILSYLSAQDLVMMCMVSTAWRKICVADPIANNRRLVYVRHIKHTKENVSWNEFKQSSSSLNVSLSSRKGIFREIQNTDNRSSTSSTPPTPRSPPVSPSKVRFTIFMKAGVALDEGKRLVRCPRCSHPSQATYNWARCQAVGCQYSFCLHCLCETHEGLPCPSRSVVPARKKSSCVGSKESRRNLRRLCL